jgi:hypothetical protein
MCVQGVQYSSVIEMGARFHFADIGHAREVLVELLSIIEQAKIHNQGSRISDFYRELDNEHLTPELLRCKSSYSVPSPALRLTWEDFLKITIQDAMELFTRGLYSSEEADTRGFEARLWSDINPSEEDFQNFEEGMQDCKVVVTRNGALAIAPESTREGDIICVFREAVSPCILRRVPADIWMLHQVYRAEQGKGGAISDMLKNLTQETRYGESPNSSSYGEKWACVQPILCTSFDRISPIHQVKPALSLSLRSSPERKARGGLSDILFQRNADRRP